MRDSISATSATIADADDTGMFAWWRAADGRARHAFVAASLGWMLDSFDVMLYSLVLASLIQDPTLQLSTAVAGQLGALTLLSAAVGGVVFGVLADRIGRKQALMAAVLIYSIFTAACGLVQNVAQLAICRILLGFGMGGEWATGVALVPGGHRRGRHLIRDRRNLAVNLDGRRKTRGNEQVRALLLRHQAQKVVHEFHCLIAFHIHPLVLAASKSSLKPLVDSFDLP